MIILPILRTKDVRKLTPDEREKKLNDLKIELNKQRALISAGGALENPSKARLLRRTIARILTIQNEEEKAKS